MRRKAIVLWVLSGILAGAVIGGVGVVCYTALVGPAPASILSMVEADGVAVRGGRIEILVSYAKDRICPTRTDRALWRMIADPAGAHMIPKVVPLASGGVVVPHDESKYLLSVDVPANIEAGEWFYTSRTVYECSVMQRILGRRWTASITQSPDVAVEITNKG